MKSYNSNGSYENTEQTLSPVADFIEATDKTIDKMYKDATRAFSNYSENASSSAPSSNQSYSQDRPGFWMDGNNNPSSYETSNVPVNRDEGNRHCHHRPWGHRSWCSMHKKRNQKEQLQQFQGSNVFQIEGSTISDINGPFGGEFTRARLSKPPQTIKLDEKKPKGLSAFPVPSPTQFEECKNLEGTSVWTKEGVWRCLFPASNYDQYLLDSALSRSKANGPGFAASAVGNGSTSGTTEALKTTQVFPDFSTYVDWKQGVRNALRENNNCKRHEWRSRSEWHASAKVPVSSQTEAVPVPTQYQQQQQQQQPAQSSFISDEKAESLNKQVISSSFTTSTVTNKDGSLETKEVIKKWYKDGTSSIIENTKNTKPNTPEVVAANNNKNNGSSGWFWK